MPEGEGEGFETEVCLLDKYVLAELNIERLPAEELFTEELEEEEGLGSWLFTPRDGLE